MREDPAYKAYWNDRAYRAMLEEREPPCVIVADDDEVLRKDVAEALRADGYDIVEIASGIDLISYLDACGLNGGRYRAPDVIVSDIRMPGFTGLEVLEGLRQMSWSVPVILMTAFGDDESRDEATRLGAWGVMDKPFDVDDLRTAVAWSTPR